MWRRYQANGDAGLVHRLRGKPGQWRTAPEVRAQILARYAERYPDFGRTVRRKRQRHRQWRERTPCSRTRVYLDGSHHDFFEGRQER